MSYRYNTGTGQFQTVPIYITYYISTAYTDTPTGVFSMNAGARGQKTISIQSVDPRYTYISKTDEVVLGFLVTWAPDTVGAAPQWFLEVDGVNQTLNVSAGTVGVPQVVSTPYIKNLSALDSSLIRIISTTGDLARYMELEVFVMPILIET